MSRALLLMLALARPPAPGTSDLAGFPPPVARWAPQITQAAVRFEMPAPWIAAVMSIESAGHTQSAGRPITSSAGAMGLMQLMPGTWDALRRRLSLGPDPHDPRDNILAGTAYLRQMRDCFGVPGLFAAYHAGPARYAEYRDRGRPLPVETQSYLGRLTARLGPIAAESPGAGDCDGDRGVPALETVSGPSLFFIEREERPHDAGVLFIPLRRYTGGMR